MARDVWEEETSRLSLCRSCCVSGQEGPGSHSICSPHFAGHRAQTHSPVVQEDERCDARLTFVVTAAERPLDRIPHLEGEGVIAVIPTIVH